MVDARIEFRMAVALTVRAAAVVGQGAERWDGLVVLK